jgi:putative membrane protein
MRFVVYFLVLIVLSFIFTEINGDTLSFLLLAFVLAITNSIVRPLLTLIALPFNFLTLGIASIFVNILTLLIADSIVNGASIGGFWLMALVSVVIMLADAFIRWVQFNRRSVVL